MRRQKGFVSVVAGVCAAIGIVTSGAAEAGCEGPFPTPLRTSAGRASFR